MTLPVSLLGAPLPATVQRVVHLLPPGRSMTCDGDDWQQALAVVEAGEIEIQTASGARLRLGVGASFCVPTHAMSVSNSGDVPAMLATVRQVPPESTSPPHLDRTRDHQHHPEESPPWT
jgi:hypothetical protein